MRVSDERYGRDLRCFHLALRLIRHEARTHTIHLLTGLSEQRIRTLCRSYCVSDTALASRQRHRGPPPQRAALFVRSPARRTEGAALAGVCRLVGAVPFEKFAVSTHKQLDLTSSERLCFAYELYRRMIPSADMTFEHLMLVVKALASGKELSLSTCQHCGALILMDRLGNQRRVCGHCYSDERSPLLDRVRARASLQKAGALEKPPSGGNIRNDSQQSLF